MYVCVMSIITSVHVLLHGVTFHTSHGVRVTSKVRSHRMHLAVCSDGILFVSKIIFCNISHILILFKAVYVKW